MSEKANDVVVLLTDGIKYRCANCMTEFNRMDSNYSADEVLDHVKKYGKPFIRIEEVWELPPKDDE